MLVSGRVFPANDQPQEYVLEVSVTDEGIGMTEEECEKVFDGRLDNTRNLESKRLNPYGNGVGLPLCKEICCSLDGNITAQSVVGVGSKFTFTMRVKRVYSVSSDYEGSEEIGNPVAYISTSIQRVEAREVDIQISDE